MSYEINWELLAKYLSGESTTEENSYVEKWLGESEENRKLFDSAKKIWDAPEESFEPSDVKALWEKVAERSGVEKETAASTVHDIQTGKNIFTIYSDIFKMPLFKYAAAVLLSALAVLLYFVVSSGPWTDEWNSVIVENGKKELITLSDSSRIYAAAGSHVEYAVNYGEESRRVRLNGEAYFTVKDDSSKPFIVYSGNAVIEVLGTRFNVRAWKENQCIKVAVLSGIVSLRSADTNENIILRKGQGSSVGKDGVIEHAYKIDPFNVMLWTRGVIDYENTRLSEILGQLERWYDVRINLSDRTILSELLTVQINSRSLAENLDKLSRLTSTEYSIKDSIVTLTPTR